MIQHPSSSPVGNFRLNITAVLIPNDNINRLPQQKESLTQFLILNRVILGSRFIIIVVVVVLVSITMFFKFKTDKAKHLEQKGRKIEVSQQIQLAQVEILG
jgi:hypothetical protein